LATEFYGFQEITSEQLVNKAIKVPQNIGIAYTYNEPFTFYEFMFETATLSHEKGLKNVVVSNGYVNPEPLKQLLPFIDAFNIDLKAFTGEFYKKQTKGKLTPVLQALKTIAASNVHLEITNLVIPTQNDDETVFEEMVKWIAGELGPEVPLHLSRYFPQYEMDIPATREETLEKLYDLAKNHLHFVYLGNVNDEKRSSTFCPQCGSLHVSRNRYSVFIQNLTKNSCCAKCGRSIKIAL
jgi:pyruvate formate lyase activating enzyme